MRKNNQRKSNFVKNLAAAVCIIGVGSLAFQGQCILDASVKMKTDYM